MKRTKHSQTSPGFSAVTLILALVIILGIGGTGWYVWQKNHKKSHPHHSTGQPNPADIRKEEELSQEDAYEGWNQHNNTTYGISFRYPSDWNVEEGTYNSPSSATNQEFAINLKRNEEAKYNATITTEINNQDLATTEVWFDKYFAGSTLNKVTKTPGTLKGKPGISYVVSNTGSAVKLYLIEIGAKTYTFESNNEDLNAQLDSAYWSKFDKVFKSLTIQ